VTDRECRIYAPKFPKSQTEGWFVIIADVARDEVIAVKRVGWGSGPGRAVNVGSRPNARAVIKLPSIEEVVSGPNGSAGNRERKVDILVVSDGYLGLEYKVEGVEIPAAPLVDDDRKKGKGKE
jgi:antiviral helicase SLH1